MSDTAKTLSDIAPTLVELKKLTPEQKCRLLLARLAKMGQHDSAINKHNLMLPGDPYGLAGGYPEVEKTAVREHLLGAPWARLVNEGFLVDLSGNGFYKVSDEGREYLLDEEAPPPVSPSPQKSLRSGSSGPRAFLSYSNDDPEHKRWIKSLAERLQAESGVEVIFDGWYLNPGDDKNRFMEQGVAQSDFVIIVCTQHYAERANNREGGVGYESMVITTELAEHILTNKFIPVLRNGSWKSSLPIYLKSRVGADLTSEPYGEDEYEKLLRVLHGELIQPPPVGNKPDFSKKPTTTHVNLKTATGAAPDSPSDDTTLVLNSPDEIAVRISTVESGAIRGIQLEVENYRLTSIHKIRIILSAARSFDSRHADFRESILPAQTFERPNLIRPSCSGDPILLVWKAGQWRGLITGEKNIVRELLWPDRDKSEVEKWKLSLRALAFDRPASAAAPSVPLKEISADIVVFWNRARNEFSIENPKLATPSSPAEFPLQGEDGVSRAIARYVMCGNDQLLAYTTTRENFPGTRFLVVRMRPNEEPQSCETPDREGANARWNEWYQEWRRRGFGGASGNGLDGVSPF